MKADNPVETYTKFIEERKTAQNSASVDDLSKEEQNWLRAT